MMTEQMETCSHAWEYYTTTFDDTFLRCPRCGMIRLAMPGESAAMVNRPQKTRPEDGDQDGR